MVKDFYDMTNGKLDSLNLTEKKIFNYIVQNMSEAKQLSIRQLADACFVSASTIYRLIKKLGFGGYNEYIAILKITDLSRDRAKIPTILKNKGYQEEYLKNIIESVRVIRKEDVKAIRERIKKNAKIFILANELTTPAAMYIEYLLCCYGCDARYIEKEHVLDSVLDHISNEDMVIALSHSGDNTRMLSILERIKRRCTPLLVSFTKADNNMIHLITDINLYYFADEINYNGHDLTSRAAMICVFELILYRIFCEGHQEPNSVAGNDNNN